MVFFNIFNTLWVISDGILIPVQGGLTLAGNSSFREKKSTFRCPNIKFHIWFLRRILRQIQNRVRQNFISSRKLSFKRENGFLVDKKFGPTRIWIPHEKLLLLAAWVPSGLENWARHLVSKKHVDLPRNYYIDIIFGKRQKETTFLITRDRSKKSTRGVLVNLYIISQ